MGKRTTAKNRTRKNKSRRRRSSYKGGVYGVQDFLYKILREQLLQNVDMEESEERLLDNAIEVAKKKRYAYKIPGVILCFNKSCTRYFDDIDKLKCILRCVKANIDENDFKKTLVEFIKNNKVDIKKLANKFELKGLDDIILSNPEIINSVNLSDIESLLEYNTPDMHVQRSSHQPQPHPRTTRRR